MIKHIDDRRTALIFSEHALISYLVDMFYMELQKAISHKNRFNIALAGGSTPKKLYAAICHDARSRATNWDKVHIYFGDERACPLDHPDSNYKMSLDAGFSQFKAIHMHPMHAYLENEQAASDYQKNLPEHLDLVFLGMGDDGHTASLFPGDSMVNIYDKNCAIGYVDAKQSTRMTLTIAYINKSQKIIVLVTGESKKDMIKKVLSKDGSHYPAFHLGTKINPAFFILDESSSIYLL